MPVRGGAAKGRMRPVSIEVADPFSELNLQLGAGLEGLYVGALLFPRQPEPLDEDSVHQTAIFRPWRHLPRH